MKHVIVHTMLILAFAMGSTEKASAIMPMLSDNMLHPSSSAPIVQLNSTDSSKAENMIRPRPDSVGIRWSRVGGAAGGLAAAITVFHIYQNNAWWANDRSRFHVIEDPSYQADFDKCGHIFGGYYGSHFFHEAFAWAGMDSVQAVAFGALCGAFWEYYVEIEDGFASAWGFSRGDAKSDLTGATFYVLRNTVPFFSNFNYKWFYIPTQKYLQNKPDIPGQKLNFIEDYGGQSYYITMNVHGLLPSDLKPYWPKWLNLAVGIGGYNIDTWAAGSNPFLYRQKEWLITLDYDIETIFPESDNGFLNFLRRGFNYWHFPAPAYRVYPNPRFFILFPLQMSIG